MSQNFFADPALDRLVAVTLQLAGEVQVLRDRQRALEGVLRRRGLDLAVEIETWQPDEAERAAIDAENDAFVRQVLEPLAAEPR
jgi:hypothetical protein